MEIGRNFTQRVLSLFLSYSPHNEKKRQKPAWYLGVYLSHIDNFTTNKSQTWLHVDTEISQSHRQKSVTIFSVTKTDLSYLNRWHNRGQTFDEYSVESQEQCHINLYSKHKDEDEKPYIVESQENCHLSFVVIKWSSRRGWTNTMWNRKINVIFAFQ